MKKWRLIAKKVPENQEEVLDILLKNRGITEELKNDFLKPDINKVKLESVGIDRNQFVNFQQRITNAIEKSEKIIIFGDYDVDGIAASAILWETIYSKYKNVFPFIPDRIEEGYGLSEKGVVRLLNEHPDTKVIITVDNGIVANNATDLARAKGIDVIITDHHAKGVDLPKAHSILHTTNLCGAGIAWMLARELSYQDKNKNEELLGLAALATFADLVPLKDANRAIVKFGIESLKKTQRKGLIALFKESSIASSEIDTYKIGYIIAPRLNASGRIQSAMNALRLLCTSDSQRAEELARMLSGLNKERQDITSSAVDHASLVALQETSNKITVVASDTYNPGVIGLVASRLVESYYRPALAISIGETVSRGSARSIHGVNIIELIRSVSPHLIEAGGHPMAAGFSLKTEMIEVFKKEITKKAEETITDEHLERLVNIDCRIQASLINDSLLGKIKNLEPYGVENPVPVFSIENVKIVEIRKIGKKLEHVKMRIEIDNQVFESIAFGWGDRADLMVGSKTSIAFTLEENVWNGKRALQLKLKDLHATE